MKTPFYIFFLIIFLYSCNNSSEKKHPPNKEKISESSFYKLEVSYANYFDIDYQKGFKIISLKNPDDTSQIIARYFLGEKNVETRIPDNNATFVKIPLAKSAITSSTQAAYISKLNEIDKIQGVSEIKYFSNKEINELFNNGKIKDIGPSSNLNYEALLNIEADVFFISLFRNNSSSKIKELGLTPCLDLGYLENTPLGRAEWIKFFSLFFNKEKEADSIFQIIEIEYNAIKDLTKNIADKPTIISGKKFGQMWHVPGGKSYMAKFFEDAGTNYLWKDDKSTASIPLDFEAVYAKGAKADFWCFKQLATDGYNLSTLLSEYEPYKDFEAYKNRNIIFCNVSEKPYYEDGVLEPHFILSDLVTLIHPDVLSKHHTMYFEFLKDE